MWMSYLCVYQVPPSPAVLQGSLLPKERYHIYAIGTQVKRVGHISVCLTYVCHLRAHHQHTFKYQYIKECEHSIASSVVQPSKAQWEEAVRRTLGPRYHAIASHTLQVSR